MRNKTVFNYYDVVYSVCPEGQPDQTVMKLHNQVVIKETVYTPYTDEMIKADRQILADLLDKALITGSEAKVYHLARLANHYGGEFPQSTEKLQVKFTNYLKQVGHKFNDEDYIINKDDVTPQDALAMSRLHQHFDQTDKRAGRYYGAETPIMLEHPTNGKKIDIFVVPFVENSDNCAEHKRFISLHHLIEACVRMGRHKDWEFIKLISEIETTTEYDFHSEEWVTASKLIKKIVG